MKLTKESTDKMFRHLIVAGGLMLAGVGYSKTYQIAGTAGFEAQGNPGFVRINGKNGTVQGTGQDTADGKVTATVKAMTTDFTTDMSLRDKHMREKYLEVTKYPEATLALKPWTKTADASKFSGDFTLKGVTHQVDGTASVSKDGKLHAEFKVSLEDYKVGVPSFAGITVAKDVAVTIDAEVK